MQVLSCQRVVSLMAVQKPMQATRRARRGGLAPRAQRGFTLVELMVTMVIAIVLLMFAVPSFKSITLSNKLTTSANDIVSAINIARMEAIKRNSSTQFCSNSSSANSGGVLGTACGTETGAVIAMSGTVASPVLAGTPTLVTPLQLKGDAVALRFNAQGLASKVGATGPYGDTVVDICTSQMDAGNHRLIKMVAGSILETSTTSGSCP